MHEALSGEMSATGWAETLRRFNERKKTEKEESKMISNSFRRFL